MIKVLSGHKPTAIREHECMACEWILNGDGINGMGFTRPELRALSRARKNKWRIVKGQEYIKQGNTYEGEVYTFKAIPEIHAICLKYNLYEM